MSAPDAPQAQAPATRAGVNDRERHAIEERYKAAQLRLKIARAKFANTRPGNTVGRERARQALERAVRAFSAATGEWLKMKQEDR